MLKRPARSAKEEREHLLGIVHAPDDPAVALAYAAWLDAFGDATGELIRLRLERGEFDAGHPRCAEIDGREARILTEPKIRQYTMAREDVFVFALRRLGVRVEVDVDRRPREVWLKGETVSTASLARLATYPTLRRVRADEHPLTLDEIAAVARLAQIESLSVERTGLTDDSLAPLGALTSLKILYVGYNPISGEGLARLSRLSNLESLDLASCDPPRSKGKKDAPRDSAWLAALEAFLHLKALDIAYNGLAGDGLLHLMKLVALETLEIHGNRFDDGAFAGLAGLTALRYLKMEGNEITAEGLAHLRGLASLETLDFSHGAVGDDGAARLAGLTRLKSLYLNHPKVPITDEGVRHLRGLTALEDLELANHRLTDAGLACFEGMKDLRSLDLSHNAGIAGPGLTHLAALPKLTSLELGFTSVSDMALPQLKALTGLENLSLHQAKVGARAMAALKKALPNASVSGTKAER